MISGVGPQSQLYAMQQAYQTQASAFTAVQPFADETDAGAPSSTASISDTQDSSAAGASGPTPNLLSSSTLASLLGLQMVNGQADGGASGAQLNLPQTNMASGMDPNSLLSAQTLQMLQSIGS